MPVRIIIDPHRVAAKVVAGFDKGMNVLAGEILADCNEYCKEDQHTLINSSMIHSDLDAGKLVWSTPYARRQYWDIRTSLTPGRTWKWCDTAKKKYNRRWQRLAQRLLEDNL